MVSLFQPGIRVVEVAKDGSVQPGGIPKYRQGTVNEEGQSAQEPRRNLPHIADVMDRKQVFDDHHEPGNGLPIRLELIDVFPDTRAISRKHFPAALRAVPRLWDVPDLNRAFTASGTFVQLKAGDVARRQRTQTERGEVEEGCAEARRGVSGIVSCVLPGEVCIHRGTE
jgi:hypothetical protein